MRILFVTATRIGDAVLSTGVLSHLLDRYPGARVTVAAGRDAAPLFDDLPGLERIIAIEKQRWRAHWLGLYRAVLFRRWDVVVDLRASALAYLLWAKRRYVAQKRQVGEHRVKQMARIFDLDPPPSPHLWLAPAREAEAARLVPPGAPDGTSRTASASRMGAIQRCGDGGGSRPKMRAICLTRCSPT